VTPRAPARLLGLGVALPEHRSDQSTALALARRLRRYEPKTARAMSALYRRSGVITRHTAVDPASGAPLYRHDFTADTPSPTTARRMVLYDELAPPLASAAAAAALRDAALDPAAITHLVTVSCTGISAPGLDVALIPRLGLRPDVARTHVGFMGCYGALAGLRVSSAFTSDPRARVLLVAVELCSLHFQDASDADRIVANAIFADGAAAAVLSGAPATATDRLEVLAHGSWLLPDSHDAMTWRIGDQGFEMTLSPRVPAIIESSLREPLDQWLADHGLDRDAIGAYAIHPGGPRILGAAERALHLPPGATRLSRELFATHGNMSSPTVLFLLDRLRREPPRGTILALGFGPGLVAEATLLAIQ
jgi:predicted naringenin-chalcone synthase